MSAYSLDLREKIVESVKKGVPKADTARRFGVDRATVKRYCKQLDERGTLEPRKAPGGPIRRRRGRSGMLFSCSVSYRASSSVPLFRQFLKMFITQISLSCM
jgi:transposase-like protein